MNSFEIKEYFIDLVVKSKNKCVIKQKYEYAAYLRDLEKQIFRNEIDKYFEDIEIELKSKNRELQINSILEDIDVKLYTIFDTNAYEEFLNKYGKRLNETEDI